MSYFNESYYLQSKLKQLSAKGENDASGKPYTEATLKAAFASVGLSPEDHFKTYGTDEKLNPNPYFNETEYLQAKLAQLQSVGEKDASGKDYTLSSLKAVLESTGMNAAQHYEMYGAFETKADGTLLNPSNAFDANAYFAAKLAQMKAAGEAGADTMTVADVVAAIKGIGLSPVTHYSTYGAKEAGDSKVALVQTVPSEQRVANDVDGRTMLGELVPGNYNPPSAGPDKAVAKPVAKPADMGGLAPEAVSPKVIAPTKPLPTPGDANYVKPPAGLTDTNAKPVIPPTTTEGTGPNAGFIVVDTATGKGTVVKPDGTVAGTVDVEVKPGGEVVPPKPDAPIVDGSGNNVNDKPVGDDGKPIVPGGGGGDTGGGDTGGGDTGGGGDGGGGTTPPVTPTFTVTESAADSGIWTIGKENGAVTVTLGKTAVDNDSYVFTPATGSPVTLLKTEVTTKLVVPAEVELKAALATVTDIARIDGKITLTDETLTAAIANTFAAKVSGAVKATITADTATALDNALTDPTVNAYTLTVSAGAETAAALNALDAKTSGVVVATAVTGITGSAAEFKTLLAAPAASDGGVTLGTAFTATVNGITADAAVLKALDGKTTGLITVDGAVVTITATNSAADIEAVKDIYAASKVGTAITGLGDEAVTITGGTISAADAKIITDATTGIVTATVTGSAAELAKLEADTNGAESGSTLNALTFVVTGTEATAADLNAVDARSVIDVDVSAITTITGSTTELNTLYTNKANFVDNNLGDEMVTVTAVTSSDFTNLGTVLAATSGKVTAEIVKDYATTNDAIGNLYANDVLKLGLNDGVTLAATDKNSAPDANGEWHFDESAHTFSWFDSGLKTITLTDVENVVVTADGTVTIKPGVFAVTDSGTNQWTVGNKNGDVTVTKENDKYYFAPDIPSSEADAKIEVPTIASLTATGIVLKGTADVLAGITGLSSVNTKILGATYTLADLTTVNAATNGLLTLETNNVALEGAHAALTTALTGDTNYVGNLTATDKASIAQLGDLDRLNGAGTLTAKIVEDSGTNIAGADGSTLSSYIKADTQVTVSGSDYTAAQLKAINDVVGASKLILATKTVAMSGDLAVLNAALDGITDYTGVLTVTDKATIAQLTTLDAKNGAGAATTGKIVEDTVANLLPSGSASALIASDAAVTVTSTGTAALGDLKKIDAATTGTVTATGITALTGSAADAKTVLVTNSSTTVLGTNKSVTLNDADATAISATDLSALDAKVGTGTVTVTNAVNISGTAVEVNKALVTDGVVAGTAKITLSDTTGPVDLAILVALDGKTSGNIDASNVVTLSGSDTEALAVLATSASGSGNNQFQLKAGVAVTIDNSDPITAANAKTITDATTGIVTAAVSGSLSTFATLEAKADAASALNALTITVTDSTGTFDATDLTGLRAKTSVSVEVTEAVTIAGTSAELLAALDTAETKVTIASGSSITVNGAVTSTDLTKFLDDVTDGAGVITIDNTVAGAAQATLDFGSVDRALVIKGGASGDTITGGTLADSITLEAAKTAADTVNINFNSTGGSEASNSTATAFDTITNFGAAGANADKLVLVDGNSTDVTFAVGATANLALSGATVTNGLITAGLTGADAAAKIAALFADATFQAATAGTVLAFVDNGDTYVVMTDGAADAEFDVVVKLDDVAITGITSITSGEFVFTVAD